MVVDRAPGVTEHGFGTSTESKRDRILSDM